MSILTSRVESTTHLGCLLKPAGDGVPGNPFDPGNRENADTLDSESDDLCLQFIHPGAPNLISLRSVGTIPA